MATRESVRDYCLSIIEGPALADKLRRPAGSLTDSSTSPSVLIDAPARSESLRARGGAPLPSLAALEKAGARVTCLQRFAHHELMAVELFAWALLAWPEAPPRLRRGWLAVLHEEQTHLELYLDRVSSLGAEFGEGSASDYFWRHVPAIRNSPHGIRAFLCAMGLTLEQANLDFTLTYGAALERAGDVTSAAVMARVHHDEIRHVRLAVQWMRRLSRRGQDDVDAYEEAVPFPLGAARAKGRQFDAAGRRESGMSLALIEHVRTARPRGGVQPPLPAADRGALLWPNLNGEEPSEGDRELQPDGPVRRVARLWALLHRPGSRLALGAGDFERVAWPASLGAAPASPVWDWLEDRGRGVAWWPTAEVSTLLAAAGCPLVDTDPATAAAVHDKSFTLEVARRHGLSPEGLLELFTCFSAGDLVADDAALRIERCLGAWPAWVGDRFMLKPRLGASGRGRADGRHRLCDPSVTGQFARLAEQGGAVLEPWLQRTADFSVQMFIESPVEIRILGSTRQLVRPRGGAMGNRGVLQGCGLSSSATLHDGAIREAATRVAQTAAERGLVGPCGVDAFSYVGPTGDECLRALVELNARFTTGHITLGLLERARQAGQVASGQAWAFLFRCASTSLPGEVRRRVELIPVPVRRRDRAPATLLVAGSEADIDAALEILLPGIAPGSEKEGRRRPDARVHNPLVDSTRRHADARMHNTIDLQDMERNVDGRRR